jgi:hypothetical protein
MQNTLPKIAQASLFVPDVLSSIGLEGVGGAVLATNVTAPAAAAAADTPAPAAQSAGGAAGGRPLLPHQLARVQAGLRLPLRFDSPVTPAGQAVALPPEFSFLAPAAPEPRPQPQGASSDADASASERLALVPVVHVTTAGAAVAPARARGRITAVQELLLQRYPIVRDLYAYLGWDATDERARALHTDRLVYSCVSPPLHPYLWQLGQAQVLRVEPRPIPERDTIVYCGRTTKGRIENAGRRVLNEPELLDTLRAAGSSRGLKVEEFDHLAYNTVPALTAYFSRARAIVGPHGGCLTNVLFMGCNSVVLELFPLVHGIKPPVGHAGVFLTLPSLRCAVVDAARP